MVFTSFSCICSQVILPASTRGFVCIDEEREGGRLEGEGNVRLVLWLCEMLVLLQDVVEEDKKVRAGFPMHNSIQTEITTITL